MLKAIFIFSFYSLLLISCSSTTKKTPKVEYFGALRNIMHKGDITAKADLRSLSEKKNVYALGALGNLKGEIQVFDSRPLSTLVDENGKLKFEKTFEKKATLLVYAQVARWVEYIIPNSVKTRAEFEKYLEQQATKHGIDLNIAFPFLVEGRLRMNDWHVINWNAKDKVHTHHKHKTSGISEKSKDTDVTMLGFYSQNHVGVFTHHTTNMHIHFISKGHKLGGHSDDMILGSNMILKLPEVR